MSRPRTGAPRRAAAFRRALAGGLIASLAGLTATLAMAPPASAVTTDTWTGGGANALWSTAANWASNSVPQPGDTLAFPAGAAQQTTTNDLPAGTAFGALQFGALGYSLSGNQIQLSGGMTGPVAALAGNVLNLPILLTADQTFSTLGSTLVLHNLDVGGFTLTVGPGAVYAKLFGTGHVLVNTTGAQFESNGNGTFTGTLSASAGTVGSNASSTIGAASVTSASGTGAVSGSGTLGSISLTAGGTLQLQGFPGVLDAQGNFSAPPGTTVSTAFQDCLSTSYTTLDVAGTATITGSTLSVAGPNGGTTPGSVCTVMTATGGLTGTFSGLPDGSIVVSNGTSYLLHYTATAVTLTQVGAYVWSGASPTSANWSDGANWVGGSAPVANSFLRFPAGAARATNVDDFASGTAFKGINAAAGYQLDGGNIVALDGSLVLGDGALTGFPIRLAGPSTLSTTGTATLNGILNVNSQALTITGVSPQNLVLNGSLAGPGAIDVAGDSFTEAGGGNFSGQVTVDPPASLSILGDLSQATLLDHGSVQGDHAIGAVVVGPGQLAAVGPQFPIGTGFGLTTAGAATLSFNLNGCQSQMVVAGVVDLSGSPALGTAPGPALQVGEVCEIVSNDAADAVVGTFSGLPEGSTYTSGGYTFTVSYIGGDGNDITLTVTGTPNGSSPPSTGPGPSSPAPGPHTFRVSGSDRLTTAIAASMARFPVAGSVSAVVLARSDDYADALASAPLAAVKQGPLLLSPGGAGLDGGVQAEILRVLTPGGTVYVVGGNEALPPSVDAALSALGFQVVRLSGADRFETATRIAHLGLNDPSVQLLVTGTDFGDALAAGAAASVLHAAILLTDGNHMAPATAAYLGQTPGTRYAVGGPAVTAMSGSGPFHAEAGSDRYATAVDLAQAVVPNPARVGLATGLDYADALVGGADVGAQGGPLLLTPPNVLPDSVAGYLTANKATITSVDVFGGTAAVSDGVVVQAASDLT